MLLEIYNGHSNDRIDVIRTYTFVQYTDYFNDVGTFTVKVPITEKSLPNLMVEGNYILFEKLGDKLEMGVIKYFHKEGLETPTVEVKGYMLSHLLTYRVFQKTFRMYGRVFEIQRDFVTKMFINCDDLRRQIDTFMLSDNYSQTTPKVQFCETGKDAAEAIKDMNTPYGYGFALTPAIAKYNPTTGRNQNIMNIVFRQYVPAKRTIGNTEGNDPVVFDMELSNLSDLMYEVDATQSKNIAIVAGEDTGQNRKVIEVGVADLSGIDRNEMYVDARDLQIEEIEPTQYLTYDETITLLNQMFPNGV